jgi:tetratricopeptide (TPR) repeat protein
MLLEFFRIRPRFIKYIIVLCQKYPPHRAPTLRSMRNQAEPHQGFSTTKTRSPHIMKRLTSIITLSLALVIPKIGYGAGAINPVLKLPLTWKPPSTAETLNKSPELFDDEGSNKKAIKDFRSALSRLNKSNSNSDQSRDVGTLRQAALKLGPRARLVAELTAARVAGGISPTGNRVGTPTTKWRGHLLAACNIAAKIEDELHEKTALYALTLWRKIEVKDQSWASPPIDIKAQRTFDFFKPIIERQALYDWHKGQSSRALRKYRALSRSLAGTQDGGSIDLRIIGLENILFGKTKQVRRWQKVLVEFATKYSDDQSLGAGNEKTVQTIRTRINKLHKDLVDTQIRSALAAKASDADRNAALRIIDVYLSTEISPQEKERVRAVSGEIHFSAKRHKAASSVFAALATESQGTKSANYWRKAIRSQIELAGWSSTPPWSKIPKGNLEARIVLLDMYKKIDDNNSNNWELSAHVGLLLIATNQQDEALPYWNSKLEKRASGPNASRAAGWIADKKIKTSDWSSLEKLARLLVKSKLTAVTTSKTYRPNDLLGLALIEGGLAALKSNDYKTAVSKLQEFVSSWRRDARHGEAMYNLALAYHGDQQYRVAVKTMEDFTKTHRRSPLRKDALKLGGNWTLALAWDEHVIYFLEAHSKEYPNDEDSINSMTTLTDLYLGREIYDAAMRVMNSLLDRKDFNEDQKTEYARRLMDTAERYSSASTSLRIANRLQNMFKNNSIISAIALSARARSASEKGNIKALEILEKNISDFDQSEAEIAEITGEIRFRLAEALARNQFKEEVFNLGVKDPLAELEKGYTLYSKIDKTYKSSCQQIRSSWCGPALHQTARVGDQFLKAFDQLSIAKTLEPKIVKDFYDRKKSILETVENQVMDSDEKSLEQASSGATNPEWTSVILWQNGSDWNRQKYTSETAEHYIQWRTR